MDEPSEGVWGEIQTRGGTVRATILPGESRSRIRSVRFSGTFRSEPESFVRELEAVLAGSSIDEAPRRIERYFSEHLGEVRGVEPGELLTALTLAVMKVHKAGSTAPDPAAWKQELP